VLRPAIDTGYNPSHVLCNHHHLTHSLSKLTPSCQHHTRQQMCNCCTHRHWTCNLARELPSGSQATRQSARWCTVYREKSPWHRPVVNTAEKTSAWYHRCDQRCALCDCAATTCKTHTNNEHCVVRQYTAAQPVSKLPAAGPVSVHSPTLWQHQHTHTVCTSAAQNLPTYAPIPHI
jgi:hypothetical protein